MSSFHCRALGITRSLWLLVMLAISGVFVLGQPALAQEVLTNDAVVKTVKAGLEESLIVDMIRSKPGFNFDG